MTKPQEQVVFLQTHAHCSPTSMNDVSRKHLTAHHTVYLWGRMKHPPIEKHQHFPNESEVCLVSTKQFEQLWLMSCLPMVYQWRKDWDCATTLTALIPAAPATAAAAGMWKAPTPKKKRRTNCEKHQLCNISVRVAKIFQTCNLRRWRQL